MDLTLTIIQTDLFWEDKKANLEMLSQKIEDIREKTEIVVLPEMFSTGFSMNTGALGEKMDGETIRWMKEIAGAKKIILTGSLIIEEDGRYFNRLIWMLPNGQFTYYDKRHLFAFAEEHLYYTPGKKRNIVTVREWKINLLICYDLRFPVWARQAPLFKTRPAGEDKSFPASGSPEFDIMILVANWPEKRSDAWRTLLRARAIENQCYVVGVNRVGEDGKGISYRGHSAIINALGEILYEKANEEDVFTFTLQKEKLNRIREGFPFWRDADEFKL